MGGWLDGWLEGRKELENKTYEIPEGGLFVFETRKVKNGLHNDLHLKRYQVKKPETWSAPRVIRWTAASQAGHFVCCAPIMRAVSAYPAALPPTPRLSGPVPGQQKPSVGAGPSRAAKNPIKSFTTRQRIFWAGWALNGFALLSPREG